jgi:SAM-dependent methyltransferase
MTGMACEICGNGFDNQVFAVREMMFGLREVFEYMECSQCGCLQLIDVPGDLSRFYPENYYSLGEELPAMDGPAVALIKKARTNLLLRAPVGMVEALVRSERVPSPFMWLAGMGLTTTSAVCDLGAGNGQTLAWMLCQGFSNLAGFDPYISEDRNIDGRISIRRLSAEAMTNHWDLIMLNHAFEHMAEPAAVLEGLRDHIHDDGRIVIRVPVADSWAWRTYGTDWVQLDAPRHLFIHTRRSIEMLAKRAGLVVSRVFYDSYALQFWGSEQYKRDIPLRDPRSYGESTETDLWSAAQLGACRRRAASLNRRGDGDSAGFVLRNG